MVTFASVLLWASLGSSPALDTLYEAARVNDVAAIRQLLAGRMLGFIPGPAGADLNAPCAAQGYCVYRTPLMVAAEAGSREAVAELIARGSDPWLLLEDPLLGPVNAWCLALMSSRGKATLAAFPVSASGARAVCVDGAELIRAAREGYPAEVRYRLEASPSQESLAYALNASIGRRELDPVRPELISRLINRYELMAPRTAVRVGDTVSLSQLAQGGARSASEPLLEELDLHHDDYERAQVLREVLELSHLTTGQALLLLSQALAGDQLETLDVLSESTLSLGTAWGAASDDHWYHSDAYALQAVFASRDPARMTRALLALGLPLANADVMGHVIRVGNCEVAAVLADAGAELNQVDETCRTPAEMARQQGSRELARALEEATRGHPRLSNQACFCADTAEEDPLPRRRLRCPGWR